VILLAPVALTIGLSDGIGHAHLAGWYHDEEALSLRVGWQVHPRVAIDAGFSEDLERVELGLHAGARVRPLDLDAAPWFYLRGDVALVGASHLGSNYDLTAGAGAWRRVCRWAAVHVELDGVARVGELDTQAIRLEAGVAIASPAFWTHI
jgi:hypothetical protein